MVFHTNVYESQTAYPSVTDHTVLILEEELQWKSDEIYYLMTTHGFAPYDCPGAKEMILPDMEKFVGM